VKKRVHELFANGSMGSYHREVLDLPNVSPSPFVYVPQGSTADDYDGVTPSGGVQSTPAGIVQPAPRTQQSSSAGMIRYGSPAAPSTTQAPSASNSSSQVASASPLGAKYNKANTDKSGNLRSDKLGRILIPKKALNAIGLHARDVAYVDFGTDGITIRPQPTATSKAFNVDCYTNLKIKMKNDGSYKIEGDNKHLSISPA
jgi:bifunctional DNA-binding transcriptional regulator/antitoxin component of YhaV-PrlF toxin-antitoxin module